MFALVDLLFILILVGYGIAVVFNLPFRYGISKFTCLFFFAAFFVLDFIWPRPEGLIQTNGYMYFWIASCLLDPDVNIFIFRMLICYIGIAIFSASRSRRRYAIQHFIANMKRQPGSAVNRKQVFIGRTKESGPYAKIKYKNIEVCYSWSLNGGGIVFAPEFVHVISRKVGKVGHVFEYCAGPGFIGFCLLAHNLCDKLTLADINPEAVEAVKETIRINNLQDRVVVYQSDCLDSIPDCEKWDLVVSNPPWCLCAEDSANIRVSDTEGRVHEKFYLDVHKFLKPHGSVFSFEGAEYTDVDCFRSMIESGGLRIVESFRSVSFFEIGQHWRAYEGLSMPQILFLRLCLFIREAYFVWTQRIA